MPRISQVDIKELLFIADSETKSRWSQMVEEYTISTLRNIRSDCSKLIRFSGTNEFEKISMESIELWVDEMKQTELCSMESLLRRIRSLKIVATAMKNKNDGELEFLYSKIKQMKFEPKLHKTNLIMNDWKIKTGYLDSPEYCRNVAITLLIQLCDSSEDISNYTRDDYYNDFRTSWNFIPTELKNVLKFWIDKYPYLENDWPLFFPFSPRGYKPIRKKLHYSTIWKIRCDTTSQK